MKAESRFCFCCGGFDDVDDDDTQAPKVFNITLSSLGRHFASSHRLLNKSETETERAVVSLSIYTHTCIYIYLLYTHVHTAPDLSDEDVGAADVRRYTDKRRPGAKKRESARSTSKST